MLYNNPIAYGTDVSAGQMRELAECANLHAVKESSGDVRRVTAIREYLGDRLRIFSGLDDMILESIPMGASGWVAGLVNALPDESVRLFEAGRDGRWDEARTLYEWFLPLLRLDTVPKFVQLIKLVQTEVGQGNAAVRPPRLELDGAELVETRALIRERLACRPSVVSRPARRTPAPVW
jgi:4-hydroxy-tetrahydrodipicolinate synthase